LYSVYFLIIETNVYYRHLAKDIEGRLRAQYTMIDKTSPAAIAAAQQAGLPINDQGELIGEIDLSGGFGVGPASDHYKLAPSSIVVSRKKETRKPKKDTKPRSAISYEMNFTFYNMYLIPILFKYKLITNK